MPLRLVIDNRHPARYSDGETTGSERIPGPCDDLDSDNDYDTDRDAMTTTPSPSRLSPLARRVEPFHVMRLLGRAAELDLDEGVRRIGEALARL